MAHRIASYDWSRTGLGTPDNWPAELKVALSLCLHCQSPTAIWWHGEPSLQFYNDACALLLQPDSVPDKMVPPGQECWGELWPQIEPLIHQVFDSCKSASLATDALKFSLSPLVDASGKSQGVWVSLQALRTSNHGSRLRTLRTLANELSAPLDILQACQLVARVLNNDPIDLPQVLIYLYDDSLTQARLVAKSGLFKSDLLIPESLSTDSRLSHNSPHWWSAWQKVSHATEEKVIPFDQLSSDSSPTQQAVIFPLNLPLEQQAVGFALIGLHRPFIHGSDHYTYLHAIIGHLIAAISNAKALNELRKNELRLNLALSGGQMGLWEWHIPSHSSIWNTRLYEIVGAPLHEKGVALSKRFMAAIHPDDKEHFDRSLTEVIQNGGNWQHEFRIIRPDGEVRWLQAMAKLYLDAHHQAETMIGVNYDITDRKQNETAVRINRERLEFLTDASQVGIWFCDLPFNELAWDHRVKEHFWLPSDAKVTIEMFYALMHPLDREPTRHAIETAIANNRRYDVDYRTVSPTGEEKWIRAIGHSHYDSQGQPIRFDGVTIDITDRKRVEERNLFLVRLDDALRPLSTPQEITITAARVLGEYLHVDRCAYADVEADEDTMNLMGNYLRTPDIKSIVGRMKFADFGAEVLQLMREGKPYIVHDIDSHGSMIDFTAYRATQIQAVICVPLLKSGRFVAAMAVHSATPRHWMTNEVELLSAVASRCWESIERVRLERDLNETERLFRTMADVAPVLMWISDTTKAATWFNKGWLEFTDRPLEDLLGDGWRDDVHPDDFDPCLKTYTSSFDAREPFSMDYRLRRHDGTYRWMLDRGLPRYGSENEFLGYVGSCVDITERRITEEKLRESEERFRAFVTASSDVVYQMNADWSEVRQILGRDISAENQDPTRDWMEKYIYPEDHARVQAAIQNAIRNKSTFELEHRIILRDGTIGWTLSRAIPLLNANGEITEWFGAASDVTERRRAEEALRESEERARAASAAKDSFLAQLSHELRTPLTPVLMTAATFREDPTIQPSAREAFEMIERHVALEARLIDDLLDLTRVTRGKLALREEWCNAHQLIQQAVDIVRDEVREKQLNLSVEPLAKNVSMKGDPARLQQVFWNLLQNAVKYTPSGGTIQITTRDVASTSSPDSPNTFEVYVKDNGVGFEPHQADQLFQSFYQTEPGRSGGLGLGLAIARAIIDLHHGSITAYSPGIGKGATFTVSLPASELPAATGTEPNPLAGSSGNSPADSQSLRLLLVEDHETTLKVLTRLLTRAGHQVQAANCLREARNVAAQNSFDAVVSDLGLPDGTGTELMRELRDTYNLRGIALSGYGMEEDVRRSHEAGFVTHLVKPVKFEELQRALEKLRSQKAE